MRRLLHLAFTIVLAIAAHASDAETDWQAVLALDAGPAASARSAADAQTAIMEHVAKQERALRGFLAAHPGDGREFEARLRLVRVLSMRSLIKGGSGAGEWGKLLDEMEKSATPEQRTEIEFTRLAETMRAL